jgi:Fe-S cluster assembly ATP-binding protein
MADLVIRGLHASIDGAEILKGVDLELSKGEVHAIMGPNGSGKSTLAHVLMGHPAYEVTGGEVIFKGEEVLELEPNERSQLGLFLAFQYPAAIPGVTVANFLRMAVNAHRRDEDGNENPIRIPEFRKLLQESMEQLKIDRSMTSRYLNDGFSGGEKKRMEMLQMAILRPEIAILDETDSGLDIDALRIVADGVNTLVGPEMGALVITHYSRLLKYIKPDHIHVLVGGRIVRSGGPELADELERDGYTPYGVEEAATV